MIRALDSVKLSRYVQNVAADVTLEISRRVENKNCRRCALRSHINNSQQRLDWARKFTWIGGVHACGLKRINKSREVDVTRAKRGRQFPGPRHRYVKLRHRYVTPSYQVDRFFYFLVWQSRRSRFINFLNWDMYEMRSQTTMIKG